MRRKDKEVTDKAAMESIIRASLVCRIALCDGDRPYVVPMCFGYDGRSIYLHSAGEGRKIDILKRNPGVCFEFESDCEVRHADKPCSFSMRYRSVMGSGKACFLDDAEERQQAMQLIIGQYTDKTFIMGDKELNGITIIRIDIDEITGKQSGY